MDSKILEEVITCGICFELFNEDNRCPRVSSCGHTFCHSCLEKILKQNSLCPACKVKIHSEKAESIPINFTVKGMISVVNHEYSGESQGNSCPMKETLILEGFCTKHCSYKELRCMDCEIWICAMCGVLQHKQCRLLLAGDAYKEMKIQVYLKIEKELESRNTINESIRQSLEILEEEKKELNKEIKKKEFDLKICEKRIEGLLSLQSEDNKFCEILRQPRTAVVDSSETNEFSFALGKLEELIVRGKMLSSHLDTLYYNWPWPIPKTTEELRKLCNVIPVYAVDSKKYILYGKVKMKNRRIRISSFHSQIPEGHFIPFEKLLFRFSDSMCIPKKAFLKLAPEGEAIEEVDLVIETDGASVRSKNFLLLCSSLMGQTYKGRTLEFNDSSFYELNPGPPSVITGVIREKDSWTTWKEGFVVGSGGGSSGFYIALEGDDSEYSLTKIGVVTFGFEKLKYLKGRSLLIKESGLVI